MRKSIVKQKLSQRLPVHCFKSNIPHCMIPELIAGQGIECIWLDFEHFSTSLETAFSLVQACRGAGADSMLRVGRGEFARASRMLDCIERVARAADKHNKAWGMPVQSPDHGKELIDMGALFLSHGSDTSVIRQTIRTMQKGFRGLGIEYRCEPES